MLVTTEALILRSIKYGDTSRIVTMFTKDFGKMSVIAKGARGKIAKFGSALEPLSHAQIVFYHKAGRDLQLLSQAEVVTVFRSIISEERKMMMGFTIIEFVNAVTQVEDKQEGLYRLALDSLLLLNGAEKQPGNALIRFLVLLAAELGYSLDTEHCLSCRAKLSEETVVQSYARFDVREGGFYCTRCSNANTGRRVTGETCQAIRRLGASETDGLFTVLLSSRAYVEATSVVHEYLVEHVEGLHSIRSLALTHPET